MNLRFNPDCLTFDEVVDYYNKRALQLLRHGYKLLSIDELPHGAHAIFEHDHKPLHSLYIYPDYRGKGQYAVWMEKNDFPTLITSDDCDLRNYFNHKGYDYHNIDIYSDDYYDCISKFYGTKKAERSGVEYMKHIDEGLAILTWMHEEEDSETYNMMCAYAMHPVLQSDVELASNMKEAFFYGCMTKTALIYAMEYRSVANEYLSKKHIDSISEIRLSPLRDVNDMLIADKVQNFKDFELYHDGTHPRSEELRTYFNNWLIRLGLDESDYEKYKQKLIINPKITRINL